MDIILSGEENNLIGYWNFDQEGSEECFNSLLKMANGFEWSNCGTPFMEIFNDEDSPLTIKLEKN